MDDGAYGSLLASRSAKIFVIITAENKQVLVFCAAAQVCSQYWLWECGRGSTFLVIFLALLP
ncbi:hypothetical protein E2C01_097491 [Portunus trituberculatus]|uniref:Uncharacterized protein n=1 Tax=Portunus trituberculatus TaxID=210409 RepID=A0A5B7K4K3_PORTR|nr:hypothetical protein [Portunus trituberculatus]